MIDLHHFKKGPLPGLFGADAKRFLEQKHIDALFKIQDSTPSIDDLKLALEGANLVIEKGDADNNVFNGSICATANTIAQKIQWTLDENA